VSDLAFLKPLPGTVLEPVMALTGYVVGTVLVEEIRALAKVVGEDRRAVKAIRAEAATDRGDPCLRGT